MKKHVIALILVMLFIAPLCHVYAQENVLLYSVNVYAKEHNVRIEFLLEVNLDENAMKLSLVEVYPRMGIGETLIRDISEAIKAPSRTVSSHFLLTKAIGYSIEEGYLTITNRAVIPRGEIIKKSYYDPKTKVLVKEIIEGFYIRYVTPYRTIKIPVIITLELKSVLGLKNIEITKIIFTLLSFLISIKALIVYMKRHKYRIL